MSVRFNFSCAICHLVLWFIHTIILTPTVRKGSMKNGRKSISGQILNSDEKKKTKQEIRTIRKIFERLPFECCTTLNRNKYER